MRLAGAALCLLLTPLAVAAQGVGPAPARPFGGALVVDGPVERVRAADDARVAATLAADPARLGELLSDELRYAHSNGRVDTKSAFIQSLTTGAVAYEAIDYQERTFRTAAPGVVLMHGRLLARVRSAGRPLALDLNFLAVWREEAGRWRLLAWQSGANPPPAR
jgi:hypothetical protein